MLKFKTQKNNKIKNKKNNYSTLIGLKNLKSEIV